MTKWRKGNDFIADTIGTIERLAAETVTDSITRVKLEKLLGSPSGLQRFLESAAFIPWLTIHRILNDKRAEYRFEIDDRLRRICELGRVDRALGGRSVKDFLAGLRGEITRRRQENNARRNARNWNVDASLKIELVQLLDWIEDELDKVSVL